MLRLLYASPFEAQIWPQVHGHGGELTDSLNGWQGLADGGGGLGGRPEEDGGCSADRV